MISRHNKTNIITISVVLVLLAILSSQANGEIFNLWNNIENNSGLGTSFASQMTVEVTDASTVDEYYVAFTFRNAVGTLSSITDVYFADGTLLGIHDISSSSGVAFSEPASPSNLPGWDQITPPFTATNFFSADSSQPITANGINATGEWLTITFELNEGSTFDDVLEAIYKGLYNPTETGALRIGIHVQGIGGEDGDSDSFVLVPLPATILLGLIGLGIGGWKLRKSV